MATEPLIKDPIFGTRGPISQQTLNQLAIRGADTQIDDAISRLGWNKKAIAVVPILSTEAGSSKILGSRLAVRGTIAWYSMKASSIWPDAGKDVSMEINLEGTLTFPITEPTCQVIDIKIEIIIGASAPL